jgi:hypothetical protein
MKPCDCKDIATASKLEFQGISTGNYSISVEPNSVVISSYGTTMKIPMQTFKKFAEFYLEEQEIK